MTVLYLKYIHSGIFMKGIPLLCYAIYRDKLPFITTCHRQMMTHSRVLADRKPRDVMHGSSAQDAAILYQSRCGGLTKQLGLQI